MKLAAAVLGALYLPAVAADQWVVAAPAPEAKVAPTVLVIPGREPESWPLDYALAPVGAPCGAEASPDHPEWRLVLGRNGTAVRCEVKK
jgi:hypothetical protein